MPSTKGSIRVRDLNDLALQFPLVRICTYLNTAGVGLTPRSVIESMNRFNSEQLSKPPYEQLFDKWLKQVERTRGLFAKLIKASTETVSFQQNTSMGVNLVLEMIGWKRGDNVVFDDLHFPSDVYSLFRLKRLGVELRMIRSKGGYVGTSDYEHVIDERTKLVTVSLVSWLNGFREDVKGVGKVAKEKGALYLVDATHGVGYVDIDVQSWMVDFLTCSNYKWLMAPPGIAELYIRKELLEGLDSPHAGWNASRSRSGLMTLDRYTPTRTARKFEPGNPSYYSIFGLDRCLRFIFKTGIAKIGSLSLRLASLLREELEKRGAVILSPEGEDHQSAFVLATFGTHDHEQMARALSAMGIHVTARRLEGRTGLRVSPYFYNSEADIERFVRHASKLAPKTRVQSAVRKAA